MATCRSPSMHVPSPKSSNAFLANRSIEVPLPDYRMRPSRVGRHWRQAVANSVVCSSRSCGKSCRSSVYFGDEFSDRLLILSAHIRELDALSSLFCPDHCPVCLEGQTGDGQPERQSYRILRLQVADFHLHPTLAKVPGHSA